MKKYIGFLISLFCVFLLSLQISAKDIQSYNFDDADEVKTVTNTLAEGGKAVIESGTLKLNSSYALDLGEVGDIYSVTGMVKVTSRGGFETIVFKNMGNVKNQKWNGFKFDNGIPTVWIQGDGHTHNRTIVSENAVEAKWVHIAYVEDNGTAHLYIDGEKIGTGEVLKGKGKLYFGATLWAGDAIDGNVDNLRVFDHALTEKEVRDAHEANVEYYINVPDIAVGDIVLTKEIGTAQIEWTSSDFDIINSDGEVSRADTDKNVKLTASINNEVVAEFDVLVLKKGKNVNKDVILSYDFKDVETFTEFADTIIRDKSGNGNDAVGYNGLRTGEDGAIFDGKDDYVKMADGVLMSNDEVTFVAKFRPDGAQKHAYLYSFGNSVNDGYIFLNPSRPGTNLILFAGTKSDGANEKVVASLPGIRHNEWATVVISVKGSFVSMYVDGVLVMDGDIGMTISSLGNTKENYLAKSMYNADPCFAGVISEFTVYSYAMDGETVRSLYKNNPEYLNSRIDNIITSAYDETGKLLGLGINKPDFKIESAVDYKKLRWNKYSVEIAE